MANNIAYFIVIPTKTNNSMKSTQFLNYGPFASYFLRMAYDNPYGPEMQQIKNSIPPEWTIDWEKIKVRPTHWNTPRSIQYPPLLREIFNKKSEYFIVPPKMVRAPYAVRSSNLETQYNNSPDENELTQNIRDKEHELVRELNLGGRRKSKKNKSRKSKKSRK